MKKIKFIYFLLVALISLRFFSLNLLDDRFFDVLEFIVILSIIGMHFFLLPIKSRIKGNFTWIISLMMIMPIISFIPAYTEHDQSVYYSLLASRTIFLWLLYFLLHKLRPDKDDILKLILVVGLTWSIINIGQQFTYPKIIFVGMEAGSGERGVVRIFFRDVRYAGLAFFIVYFSILKKFSLYKLIGLVILVWGILMTGTRQIIFSLIGLSVAGFVVYNRKNINYKMVLGGIAIVIIGIFVLKDYLVGLIIKTMEQDVLSGDYIRIICAKFFLIDYSDNIVKVLFGNGWDHALSPYGAEINYYKHFKGFYRADIGMIGGYSMFGILKILIDFMLLVKLLLFKNDKEIMFIKFFFLFIAMTSFTGQYFFSYYPTVVLFCFVLYYLDFYKTENNKKQLN